MSTQAPANTSTESAAIPTNKPAAIRNIRMVALSAITLDNRVWPRQELDTERVKLFTELYANDPEIVPPVELFSFTYDKQEKPSYVLVDGMHRFAARKKVHAEKIPAIIRDDIHLLSDAYIAACLHSAASSKPLTTREKRAAVRNILKERSDLSDRAIARIVGCSPTTVSAQRNPLRRMFSQGVDALTSDGGAPARSAPRSVEERAVALFTHPKAEAPDVATLTELFRSDSYTRAAAARWANALVAAYRASEPASPASTSTRQS